MITSLMDVYNNNLWLVEKIAKTATDDHWPRVDVKSGPVAPGVNGGLQGAVRSPMNKGRAYRIPGIGLAGDWPGGWTQAYAQVDTEAGPGGFDKHYFVQQIAGLSQLAGEMMLVNPKVIDLGWGELRSAIANLADSDFASGQNPATPRKALDRAIRSGVSKCRSELERRREVSSQDAFGKRWPFRRPEKQGNVKTAIDTQHSKLG